MSDSTGFFGRAARGRWLCVSLFVFALPALAAAAPQSLRSESDLNDVVDSFMEEMVAGQVGSAYRGVARYWPRVGSELGTLVAETTIERRELRKTIGLSLGSEPVAIERAAERVVRVTRLERFDDGALVWRFIFYRPNFAWQLVDVESSADLRTLFGEPARGEAEGAGTTPPLDAKPLLNSSAGESKPEDPPTSAYGAGAPAEYEIDIDGRL